MTEPASPAAHAALVATDLRHSFRLKGEPPVQALDGVSLEARHGELTALIGPDGAGKTTLIRLAAGLLRADSGTLTVLGSTWRPIRRRCRTASATCRSALASMRT